MADPQPLEPLIQMDIVKVTREGRFEELDVVATEIPLTIMADATEVATLMCSPEHLEDLARGFLCTSGLLGGPQDFLGCTVDEAVWVVQVKLACQLDPEQMNKRTFTTGCGKGVMYASATELTGRTPLSDSFRVPAPRIQELSNWFRRYSDLHHATGGVHTVALSVNGLEPNHVRDDVGRHNAADKVIGQALKDGVDLQQTILVTSGRISSEIVHKARKASIPVIVSLGAPTHQAVLLARDMNVTLIGFARQARFSIFSMPERII